MYLAVEKNMKKVMKNLGLVVGFTSVMVVADVEATNKAPSIVPKECEVENGLVGMKRDINMKLTKWLNNEQLVQLFGVSSEYFLWKKHFLFENIRRKVLVFDILSHCMDVESSYDGIVGSTRFWASHGLVNVPMELWFHKGSSGKSLADYLLAEKDVPAESVKQPLLFGFFFLEALINELAAVKGDSVALFNRLLKYAKDNGYGDVVKCGGALFACQIFQLFELSYCLGWDRFVKDNSAEKNDVEENSCKYFTYPPFLSSSSSSDESSTPYPSLIIRRIRGILPFSPASGSSISSSSSRNSSNFIHSSSGLGTALAVGVHIQDLATTASSIDEQKKQASQVIDNILNAESEGYFGFCNWVAAGAYGRPLRFWFLRNDKDQSLMSLALRGNESWTGPVYLLLYAIRQLYLDLGCDSDELGKALKSPLPGLNTDFFAEVKKECSKKGSAGSMERDFGLLLVRYLWYDADVFNCNDEIKSLGFDFEKTPRFQLLKKK
jgi:hypothetical protein